MRFQQRFIRPIWNGDKTVTIRARKTLLKPGERFYAFCRYDREAFAKLEVIESRPVTIQDITDEIAQADGLKSGAELRLAMQALYPNAISFWLVRFKLVQRFEY